MNLGIRAHDISNRPLEELVEEVASKGLSAVQLALGKSFPDLNTSLGSLSPGFAHHIGKAFRKHDIQIAVLGCYINMIHPDLEERQKALDRFKEHIRYARDFGCSIVGTETGNVNAKMGYTVDNFHEKPFLDVVESVKELVAEAEKFGVIVGIEAGVNHPLYTPKLMRRLLDLVDSNNLQVIFDPVNLLTAETYENQEGIIEEAIDLFGDRIAIVHAKDFVIENGKLEFTAVGKGLLNYDFVMKLIKPIKPQINFLMESTTEPYIDDSIAFLREKYENA
ncbi:sugar phosphate isomerase/epimerase family protein [Bacillus sp. FJAT-50079]|uniref:sugar phosphate isomerase/epimerase family protein n=1 Tax=Bacillus sp. FJAT-50079 TaxID=2833577 RepID=UPI001BC8CD51|nr:sugar phosphate isomerase/epimerase family protein [Bacillus sp. FJAT-50079]MBS4207829.1 sugar phosphate isomerase/epimerase [Bacillus sp. FJAT-50079]